jgi:hypothetical protein
MDLSIFVALCVVALVTIFLGRRWSLRERAALNDKTEDRDNKQVEHEEILVKPLEFPELRESSTAASAKADVELPSASRGISDGERDAKIRVLAPGVFSFRVLLRIVRGHDREFQEAKISRMTMDKLALILQRMAWNIVSEAKKIGCGAGEVFFGWGSSGDNKLPFDMELHSYQFSALLKGVYKAEEEYAVAMNRKHAFLDVNAVQWSVSCMIPQARRETVVPKCLAAICTGAIPCDACSDEILAFLMVFKHWTGQRLPPEAVLRLCPLSHRGTGCKIMFGKGIFSVTPFL